ncbi:MAG: deoxyguanosinetriphosphate triphosphohydrolase [Tenuifilaceae bacterium]|jgi:dGTPase|nr:deoxyguanosinetriphosphate triphosphohydrolase [Tenuifilaceae bacterium]
MQNESMDWGKLLCPKRFDGQEASNQQSDSRSDFQRDYDRIIFSSAFRRLQNKTQVFPLPGSVFVHNRLTHSLEVASVGRSLGNNVVNFINQQTKGKCANLVEQIPTIVSSACLAHDMGNPPFGHSGEDAIRNYFTQNTQLYEHELTPEQWHDLIRFEGNANALRLLCQKMEGKREGGFRLSYPVLSSIVKYPWESTKVGKKKMGFFQTEKDWYNHIAQELGLLRKEEKPLTFVRHPLVFLVEAADDICYQIMDIEDAHKLNILSFKQVEELLLGLFSLETDSKWLDKINRTLTEVDDENEKVAFLRAMAIGKLTTECSTQFKENYKAIMQGNMEQSLFSLLSNHLQGAIDTIKKVSIDKIYNHRTVVEIELAGHKIIGTLLDKICPALTSKNDDYAKKVLKLIPSQYINKNDSKYHQLMSAIDFISGMTDVYALEMYRTFEGISIPGINR